MTPRTTTEVVGLLIVLGVLVSVGARLVAAIQARIETLI